VTLVVIYGAPAVGKLTTATALSALTGFKVFHNHLSLEAARAVFPFHTPECARLMEAIRITTFEAAVRAKIPGLIFTFVYAPPHDDAFVRATIDVVERGGGRVALVRLVCDRAANDARVVSGERRAYGKITTVDALREAEKRWTLTAAIPFQPGLEVDNTTLGADTVARRIAAHFDLPVAPA